MTFTWLHKWWHLRTFIGETFLPLEGWQRLISNIFFTEYCIITSNMSHYQRLSQVLYRMCVKIIAGFEPNGHPRQVILKLVIPSPSHFFRNKNIRRQIKIYCRWMDKIWLYISPKIYLAIDIWLKDHPLYL